MAELSRNAARILSKYSAKTSLQGRFADADFDTSQGLPPATVLRVSDHHAQTSPPRFQRNTSSRPVSNADPAQTPHEWRYSLAKPVNAKSKRGAWRSSQDIRGSVSTAPSGRESFESMQMRKGWKGRKLTVQHGKRKGNNRRPDNRFVRASQAPQVWVPRRLWPASVLSYLPITSHRLWLCRGLLPQKKLSAAWGPMTGPFRATQRAT
mmetsp:Transcript_18099/g.50641  ORF Transcript_18099/g.50641 Transcript_18099/m.50641 type:complete len:208 (-) Transcript_18099:402-1025(-)